MRTSVHPSSFPGIDRIGKRVLEAAAHVGLDPIVKAIALAFDAPEFEGSGFWELQRCEEGYLVTLYGSPRDVLVPGVDALHSGADEIDLELIASLADDRLDVLRLDRWLHRNLLQLDDLLRERVRPAEIRASDGPGMQACWDVWTDGRLRLWQYPGLSQAERRRVFFRVFAARGALLPRHWQTFHELWEGQFPNQDGLLRALERLPRLG